MKRTFCFVLPWSFDIAGGVNEVIRNLVRQFAKQEELRLQPLMLELAWNGAGAGDAPDEVARIHARVHPAFVEQNPLRSILGYLLHLPGEVRTLAQLAKRNNVGAFNLHFPDLQAFSFVLLRMCGMFDGSIILTFHGSDIRAAHAQGWFAKKLWRFLLRHATYVAACSDGLREEILLLEPRCRSVTIYNGIDFEVFASEAEQQFALPDSFEKRRMVANVASFEYRKGHDILIRAFEHVAAAHQDVDLWLAGKPGPVSASVRDSIREKSLEQRVHILENVPHAQLCKLLLHSELFVLATRWKRCEMGEGFAIAILEAAAAKLPVVATASCGVEEIIKNGESGMAVPLEDAVGLARAICHVLEHPEEARRMAQALHTIVRQRFTWRRAAEEYASLCVKRTGMQ